MSSLKIDRQKSQQALSRVTDQLYDELRQSTLKHWLEDRKVEKHLDQKVREWAFQAKSNLDQQHPYLLVQQQLEY
ncbi:hypothetical protein [Acinetobacter equi]|uniref:hypothetical protein n=1 Tax=Acinetobacter equi TaxID=1324350 RepID=UPI000A65E4D9|nr:hypothetical protein [Acinetobacter equi]